MADTAQDMLNAERVKDLLQLGYFLAKFPNANRDTSQAYNVMERIYRIVDGDRNKLEEMPWYRCSWCFQIENVVVSGGTTKLLRHIKKCDARPKNYVLPEHNLHVQGRAVHANVAGPSRIEPHKDNAAQQKNQDRTRPVVTDDQMAQIIARLSEIFTLYGNVGADDIKKLLPLQPNKAYLRGFYQDVKRIASHKSGIKSPRCVLDVEVPAMVDENETMNQDGPDANLANDLANDAQILNLATNGRNPNAAHATRTMDVDSPKAKVKKFSKQRKIVSKTPRIPRNASVKAKEGIKSTYSKNKKK